MIEIKRYTESEKENWNNFLNRSKIDSFLFNRNFMDYHSDRFEDHSFLIYRKGKLEAVLPGNIEKHTFYSHQGLTYGGLVPSSKISLTETMKTFGLINVELKKLGIKEVIYKSTPIIYHQIPSQEDIYCLFRLNAIKIGCNISSTITQQNKVPFIESRKSGIRKAKNKNIKIVESEDFTNFWIILENNLKTIYGKKTVHSLQEITLLKERFPEQIKLYVAIHESTIIGGSVLFIMKEVIHVQYIAASEQGKKTGALDLLFDFLINEKYLNFPIFDFGQSTEQMGTFLNENLIFQKEGFGGRGIVYDVYKYNIY